MTNGIHECEACAPRVAHDRPRVVTPVHAERIEVGHEGGDVAGRHDLGPSAPALVVAVNGGEVVDHERDGFEIVVEARTAVSKYSLRSSFPPLLSTGIRRLR